MLLSSRNKNAQLDKSRAKDPEQKDFIPLSLGQKLRLFNHPIR
jgi:hypothetical protein